MSEEDVQEQPEKSETEAVDPEAVTEEITAETQLEQARVDLEKAQSDFLYLRAEFENYKKTQIKERSDYLKYGSERLIVSILDVLDNFDRALEAEIDADNIESFRKGMEMTASEFKSTLKKFGVEEISCKGEAFDPTLHEALSSIQSDEVKPGHIAQVFKGAYKLHERVIRPAQVVVAKE